LTRSSPEYRFTFWQRCQALTHKLERFFEACAKRHAASNEAWIRNKIQRHGLLNTLILDGWGMAGRKEAETSVTFALMIMSVGAEGLDMMRIKDLNICGIQQSTDELSAMSAQEKIAVMRASRIKLSDASE
jgi:hypothetical protein